RGRRSRSERLGHKPFHRPRIQDLPRHAALDLVAELLQGIRARKLRSGKLSRRRLEKCRPKDISLSINRGKIDAFLRLDKLRIDGCAGGNDADDLASYEFDAFARRFGLFADSDAIALTDEPRDIRRGRVVGNSAHR